MGPPAANPHRSDAGREEGREAGLDCDEVDEEGLVFPTPGLGRQIEDKTCAGPACGLQGGGLVGVVM